MAEKLYTVTVEALEHGHHEELQAHIQHYGFSSNKDDEVRTKFLQDQVWEGTNIYNMWSKD